MTASLSPNFVLAALVVGSGPYPYDGQWVGEMQTTFSSGPCGSRYRLEMSVTEGAVTGSATRAGERFTLYGKMSGDGKLSWSATSGCWRCSRRPGGCWRSTTWLSAVL